MKYLLFVNQADRVFVLSLPDGIEPSEIRSAADLDPFHKNKTALPLREHCYDDPAAAQRAVEAINAAHAH